MDKRLLILILAVSIAASTNSFERNVNIHGGITKSKSMSLWEIHKYKDTKLLRKDPLCYAPWKAYLAVDKYVEVKTIDNYNCLVINKDLAKEVESDAKYNKKFAKKFKGKSIKAIYKWCKRTKYQIHMKTARDAFQYRRADCAGITAAFYVICKVNHIPVRYIIGWHNGKCHAWNRVKYKGKWYYIDCTMHQYLSRKLWNGYTVMEVW